MHVMSKSAVVGILAAVFVAGLLAGLYLLPSLYAMRAGKGAAQKVAPSAISQAIQPVVNEQAEKAAREIAAMIVTRPRDSDIDIQPVTKPDSSAPPVAIARANFEITLPLGSTVEPDDPKYGPDRLLKCRLPGNASLNLLLVDDKSNAASISESALEGLRGAVKEPTTNHESALGWMSVVDVNGIEGSIEGQQFAFETGYRPGTEKACVIIIDYPMDSEKKRAAINSIQLAISTLTVKQ